MSKSYCGKFLIATKGLRDPNFFKTVVLLVEHGESGAMGLVVNRPSSIGVAHALSEHFNLPETDDLVYVGGPVEPNALFVLHNGEGLDECEPAIVPGVHVGTSPDVFETVVREACHGDPRLRFRIFSGCAGWGPGQLEGELDRGDWLLLPACADIVFHDNPYCAWDSVIQRVYESNRIVPQLCEHPEWN